MVGKVPGSLSEYADSCRESSLKAMQQADAAPNDDLRRWFLNMAMEWHAIAVAIERSLRGSDEWSAAVR